MFDVVEKPDRVAVRLSATLANVDRAGEITAGLLQKQELEPWRFAVLLVMREALINAVMHGSGEDENHVVDYECVLDKDTLTMRIRDYGQGFDWRSAIGKAPRPEDTGGRGLAIMREYGFNVLYNDSGNELTLSKHLLNGGS